MPSFSPALYAGSISFVRAPTRNPAKSGAKLQKNNDINKSLCHFSVKKVTIRQFLHIIFPLHHLERRFIGLVFVTPAVRF